MNHITCERQHRTVPLSPSRRRTSKGGAAQKAGVRHLETPIVNKTRSRRKSTLCPVSTLVTNKNKTPKKHINTKGIQPQTRFPPKKKKKSSFSLSVDSDVTNTYIYLYLYVQYPPPPPSTVLECSHTATTHTKSKLILITVINVQNQPTAAFHMLRINNLICFWCI